MTPRILVVDDLAPARRLLVDAILSVLAKRGESGGGLVETSSFTETMVLLNHKFDFAFVDLHLPDGRGWDIIRNLKKDPDILVAAVTVMDDRASVEATLAAGADGYLIKDAEPELLHFRIERLMAGEPSLSPAIARMMLSHSVRCIIWTKTRSPPASGKCCHLSAAGCVRGKPPIIWRSAPTRYGIT